MLICPNFRPAGSDSVEYAYGLDESGRIREFLDVGPDALCLDPSISSVVVGTLRKIKENCDGCFQNCPYYNY